MLLIVIIAVMILRLAPTYRIFSDTIDEPYHLGAGLCQLETGKLLRGFQHPPLARLVAALPVYLSGVRDSADAGQRTVQTDLSAFVVGHAALMNSSLGYWAVLTRARLAMLVFPIALLIYVYLLGQRLVSRWGGVVAALWLSTDPTLLGHATWIATDVPAAAGFVAILLHQLWWLDRRNWPRTISFGVAVGLAVACKFTVVLGVVPVLLLILIRPNRWRSVVQLGVAAAVSLLVLWATYGFDVDASGPMPSLRAGLRELSWHSRVGHIAYLNGEKYYHGNWLYFPEAFALKTPVAVLVAILLALFLRRAKRATPPVATGESSPSTRASSPGLSSIEMTLIGSLLALILFAMVAVLGPINIGLRHFLPAIVLIYPLLVFRLRHWPRLLAALVLISNIEAAWVQPNYLSYFNLLAGGPSGGERFLLDSNLDWGQDQQQAHEWLDAHARGRTVSLHLFGNPRILEWPHAGYTIQRANEPPRDLILVSKNIAHGLYPTNGLNAAGEEITEPPLLPPTNARPIATIGTSIDVYDLSQQGR